MGGFTVNIGSGGGGGRVAGTVFGLIFCAIPTVMICLILGSAWRSVATWFWTEVACEIRESRVDVTPMTVEKPDIFTLKVRYSYPLAGHSYQSETFRHGYEGSKDESATRAAAERFQAGTKSVCFVDPSAPSESVLVHEGLGYPALMLLVTLFPLFFLAVGIFVVVRAWRADRPKPISTQKAGGGWIALWFFGIFLAGGLAFFSFVFVPIFTTLVRASSWRETPCEVVDSKLLHSPGKGGGSWRVGVLYQYAVDGAVYRANRYDAWETSSGGREGKEEVVNRLKPGSKAVCFVNPSNPREAVMNRSPSWWLLFALLPMVFAAIGAIGVRWAWRQMRGKLSAGEVSKETGLPERRGGGGEPTMLRPESSGLGKLGFMLTFALFWNGIVSVLFFHVIAEWRAGHSPWGLTLFLVPFVLVGLGVIGGVGYYFLALFNPRVRLGVSAKEVTLGGTVEVAWEVFGRASRLRGLDLFVEGREQATYQSGKNSRTDTSVFARMKLARVEDVARTPGGKARFVVPAGSMHTFKSSHSSIRWHIVVKGDVPWWPDVKDEYELTVLPYDVEKVHEHAQG